MKKNLLAWGITLIFSMFFLPLCVFAQTEVVLDRVEVNLWPEYDQPTMLVFYDLVLTPETRLPVNMAVRIPASSGGPHAVAFKQPNGDLDNLPYTTNVIDKQWIEVRFTATTLDLRLEFYDPSLEKNGSSRHYVYQWLGDYQVNNLVIDLQQPIEAVDIRTSPSLGAGIRGNDGMTYYRAEIGPINKGGGFQMIVDYEKSSNTLSSELLTVEPVSPIESRSAILTNFRSAIFWSLLILGITLLVGGGIWYWRTGRRKTLPYIRKRNRKVSVELDEENQEVYCHRCGKRAVPGDRFCRICGTQLKI